jgi:heme oxygenase
MTSPSPLHQSLKDSTRGAHDQIERNAVLKRLLADDLTKAEYTAILARYLGFFHPLEEKLARQAELKQKVSDFESRTKTRKLEHDLAALGLSNEKIAELPRAATVPDAASFASAMGVLYVCEGSNLGGRLIAKHLSKFDFFTNETSSFFEIDPQVVGSRWKSFLDLLSGLPQDSSFISEASGAASSTFSTLDTWMAGAFTAK